MLFRSAKNSDAIVQSGTDGSLQQPKAGAEASASGRITDRLYRNRGDGTFADISVDSGLDSAASQSLAVLAADLNEDGYPDFAVTHDGSPPTLKVNRGNGTFDTIALTLEPPSSTSSPSDGESGSSVDNATELSRPAVEPQAWRGVTSYFSDRESVRHIPVHSSPFRIGRRSDLALSIPCSTVSSVHAEFVDMGDHLVLRDLRSTNGTYVNGERVHGECVLQPEDLILFADVPFRIRKQSAVTGEHTVQENLCDHALALVQFDRLMSTRSVLPFFQPIVSMQSRETVAYEVLGRSEVFGLETPSAMFRAAAQLDLEVDLSRMFRWESVQATAGLDTPPHLYMNTHPNELNRPGLLQAMQAIREMSPRQPLTLEIHEAAVTDVDNMNELHAKIGRAHV